jgi:hypothetical protein
VFLEQAEEHHRGQRSQQQAAIATPIEPGLETIALFRLAVTRL